ncbi:MAG: tRNA (adenosine(37)-N6)-threonylcarbamoyltransferase complex dimerization subunit type 1 TsaB [Kiritimatiellia bacterium]|jgi:tRNA threonylcarbamoyl adenosine modification protein YeaZ
MKILALDFSTPNASLALMEDGRLLAELAVDAGHRRSQELFAAVESLLPRAGWQFGDLDAYAVGCGPGSYAGLRVSLTAANGWALPEKKTVWAVPSPAALAAELFAEAPELCSVVISGNARRGTLWAGCFQRDGQLLARQVDDWRLLPADGSHAGEWPGVSWADVGRAPQAEWVGRLFFTGRVSQPLQPIYLHPAVSIPPRFDAAGRPI